MASSYQLQKTKSIDKARAASLSLQALDKLFKILLEMYWENELLDTEEMSVRAFNYVVGRSAIFWRCLKNEMFFALETTILYIS